jgi:hypothetical protein
MRELHAAVSRPRCGDIVLGITVLCPKTLGQTVLTNKKSMNLSIDFVASHVAYGTNGGLRNVLLWISTPFNRPS